MKIHMNKAIHHFFHKGGWLVATASALILLAMMATQPLLAAPPNQTVPLPTATSTATPVLTSTPTNTPAPATNTPALPTDTPAPGITPAPTDTPAPATTATNTPVPTFSMSLAMSASEMAFPGGEVEIRFTATNPSGSVANNVQVRNRLPDTLILISADAANGGTSFLETEENGTTVVRFVWDTVAAGQSVEATIVAMVAPDLRAGSVIDNLGVAYAANAAASTAGISIGLPPAILPFFD